MKRILSGLAVAGAMAILLPCVAVGAETPEKLAPAPRGFDVRRENVARGKVETIEYDSKAVAGKRKMVIYTPPGYSKDAKLPVFYLLHGAGDDETGWVQKGSADAILDNLYAEKKIVPMIVVMPNGFARRPTAAPAAGKSEPGKSEPAKSESTKPAPAKPDAAKEAAKPEPAKPEPAKPGAGKSAGPTRGGMGRDNSAFEADLLGDIIPYVESHYAVQAGRQSRALAGLSMGGGQALSVGLGHRDVFAWVGGFSSAPRARLPADLTPDSNDAVKGLRLLWLSCGDADSRPQAQQIAPCQLGGAEDSAHLARRLGAHAWPVWKNDLYLIAPLLFRGL